MSIAATTLPIAGGHLRAAGADTTDGPATSPTSPGLAAALQQRLMATVPGSVAFDTATRGAYSTDASNYREVPMAVALPRDTDEVEAISSVCREMGVPLTMRGGGTSVAGNAIGAGVVIDTSRHLDRILRINSEQRTAEVQAGVVLDDLQRASRPYGLAFGPDPSTHSRCTIGGMIGNNACGSHSVAWGRTADNVEALDVLTAGGTRLAVGALGQLPEHPGPVNRIRRGIHDLLAQDQETVRAHLKPWSRRVSGYSLEHLLPEHGSSLSRALVGTEGTCVTVLGATLCLVPLPAARVLVVLGFQDDEHAADATAEILPHGPLTLEGIDAQLVELVQPSNRPPDLPRGGAWLLVEVGGETTADATSTAAAITGAVDALGSIVVEDPTLQRVFWKLREEGAGTLTRTASGALAWPGWEDAAVPPERLGTYLREFNALLREHGLQGITYGHFGEGCIHVRIDFQLNTAPGRQRFRTFLEEAADLVVAHGGSLSGEHGDGRARSELLSRMYPPEVLDAFGRFKGIWDPGNRMNPGVIVDPLPLDADLRFAAVTSDAGTDTVFTYPDDGDSFAMAVHRCVGVGKCRSASGAAMCPSFQATRDERHSTRGRARLLQEMVAGELVTDGWDSEAVLGALDLCLSCKACSSDCPVNVDMATYKSEFLHRHHQGRLRPVSHYSMGWLPLWLRLSRVAPQLGSSLLRAPGAAAVVKRLAGIAQQRELPRLPLRSFTASFGAVPADLPPPTRGPVILWPDTFSNYLAPEVGRAATLVLRHLGFDVLLPRGGVCCGLTWITTGQLDIAKRVLSRSVDVLQRTATQAPIIGLEPSCTVALRNDLPRLLERPEAAGVAERVTTFAAFVDRHASDEQLPTLTGRSLSQPHCHQTAALGTEQDERLLRRLGLSAIPLEPNCCGLAGNFGFEAEHYEVSQAVGERVVLPAVRAADADTQILADGFSCRTQIEQGTDRRALHLAEVIAAQLDRTSAET